ncbi:hypothetical protein ACFVH6_02635 [Spirillospora sp. NPDC127200]
MFHNDIMYAVMQERARDMREEARARRDADRVRRARAYWAEQAERLAPRRVRRGRAVRRPATGG